MSERLLPHTFETFTTLKPDKRPGPDRCDPTRLTKSSSGNTRCKPLELVDASLDRHGPSHCVENRRLNDSRRGGRAVDLNRYRHLIPERHVLAERLWSDRDAVGRFNARRVDQRRLPGREIAGLLKEKVGLSSRVPRRSATFWSATRKLTDCEAR